ncbi:MAG: hypothetical protein M1817_002256 [Caeruleum heppii]|nr:MAG: hypothetical protein M1817_002256 [Caeruleum heppii]
MLTGLSRCSYTESIGVLYETNILSFRGSTALHIFPTLIPRCRFRRIRSLHLLYTVYSPPSTEPTAAAACDALWTLLADEMPGLRRLWIKLMIHRWGMLHVSVWKANQHRFLGSVGPLSRRLELLDLDLSHLVRRRDFNSEEVDLEGCRLHVYEE